MKRPNISMKKPQLSSLLSVQILLLFSTIKNVVLVNGQCLDDQRSHLLQLKNSLSFDLELSTRLVHWNAEEDCCSWKGIGCDASGRVITLELDNESISGGVDNLTSLFKLQFLEKLNLGLNNFVDHPFPKAISNLTNLVYLNLSNTGLSGQIPIELSSLRRLVSLDLSSIFVGINPMKLEIPTLKMLIKNLSNIEELYLDAVDLSGQRSEWSQVIATSLPKLRVLSLHDCQISGPIHFSFSSIHNLSVIRLDRNNISAVPEHFANMPYLRTLRLASCNLRGQFPGKIFQVPTLQTLDISNNELLQGSLPPFPKNSSLRTIELTGTRFSGSLPNSIENLHKLSMIDLSNCNFSGIIPAALHNLLKLTYVDLSYNNFSGPVPQFHASKNLAHIDLSYNSLTGSLSSAHFKGLLSLAWLNLGKNFLSGTLPSSIFKLPALRILELHDNQFSGQIDETPDRLSISRTGLEFLDLSSNQFNGSFPKFLFELKQLKVLSLSANSFTDTIQLETFKNLPNLTRLELSFNNLTVDPHTYNSTLAELSMLKLASCKLQSFPEMKGQAWLSHLDLSDNGITGEIPNWLWNLGEGRLSHVNLSFNFLMGLQRPYDISVVVLDLHCNQIRGEVPILSRYPVYVDYSGNRFSGPIPSLTGLDLTYTSFLSISNNSLTGSIPVSLCNAFNLLVLDLSYNGLNGTIPSCLVTSYLGVLNLAGNNLVGSIPDTYPTDCSLTTLDLGMNHLQGELPRTLSNCSRLEVLNLGNNQIEDVFPCMFENSSSLHVLILRSNKFQGELECFGYNYSWPQLQIIDISSNNFSGVLSPGFFSSLKNMLTLDYGNKPRIADILRFNFLDLNNFYYQFKVGVTMKGRATELEKILTIFTVIDFSNNKLSGNISDSIGDLKLLYALDLSRNNITGGIPSSIGKMQTLGSLDLSMNHLAGEIPSALKDINFLSFLNLSFNILTGKIPTGPQLQTFSMDSYMGNVGLCGLPLNVSCGNDTDSGSSSTPSLSNKKEIDWMYICASVGYVVGLGIFLVLLMSCERWRDKISHQLDQLLLKIFGKKRGQRIMPEWKEPIRRL